jgi:hypothetical protein
MIPKVADFSEPDHALIQDNGAPAEGGRCVLDWPGRNRAVDGRTVVAHLRSDHE